MNRKNSGPGAANRVGSIAPGGGSRCGWTGVLALKALHDTAGRSQGREHRKLSILGWIRSRQITGTQPSDRHYRGPCGLGQAELPAYQPESRALTGLWLRRGALLFECCFTHNTVSLVQHTTAFCFHPNTSSRQRLSHGPAAATSPLFDSIPTVAS